MGFGMDMAAGAANGLLGQVGGMIFGKAQDRRQLKQQEKLQKLQIAGNKEMLDYSNAAQREMQMQMWEDTNLPAQVEQAKKAGMSVASLYGGSGAGGSTTGGGGASGSVGGAVAADPNGGVGMGLQMASQLALQKAQKENIEADTENKKVDAAKKAGIDTEVAAQGLEQAKQSQDAIVTKAIFDAKTAGEQWTKTGAESQLANRTLEDQIKTIQQQALGSILENQLTKSKININKEEVKAISERIAQGWEGLSQGDKRLAIDKFNAEIKANYPGIGDTVGRILDDSIEKLFELGNKNRAQTKQMK